MAAAENPPMDAAERLRRGLSRYYEGDRLDDVVSGLLGDPLVSKMLNTPPRVLSDSELHSMCTGIDTRIRPAEVPQRKDEFLRGFAGDYYADDRWRNDPKKDEWCRLRQLIESYWNADCDSVVQRAVGKYGVHAFYFLADWILATRSVGLWGTEKASEVLRLAGGLGLRDRDLRSAGAGWQSEIARYAIARAEMLSFPFQHYIRRCLYCGDEFNDADVRPALVRQIGYIADFCEPCLALACDFGPASTIKEAVFPVQPEDLEATLRVLCKVLGVPVPCGHSRTWLVSNYVLYATAAVRTGRSDGNATIAALVPMQPARRMEDALGLEALLAAGLLRGERKAADGHKCDSIHEQIIDDWLWTHRIPHERPAYYPRPEGTRSPAKADWAVGETLVEQWTEEGDPEYNARMDTKRQIAQSAGIRLIEIGPEDLTDLDRALSEKFAEWL